MSKDAQRKSTDEHQGAGTSASAPGGDQPQPVGNAPPSGRAPLFLFGIAWVGWIVFLVCMVAL